MMSKQVSPVGTAVSDHIRKSFADPEFRAAYERLAPYEALARLVIKRRGALGLSQRELAIRMDTTVSTVSRIESGQRAIRTLTRRMLVSALGIDIVEKQR